MCYNIISHGKSEVDYMIELDSNNHSVFSLYEGLKLITNTAGTVGIQACGDRGYEVYEAGNSNCEVGST